jgi:uncharacterized glyoxalase superfamily protein PhnB
MPHVNKISPVLVVHEVEACAQFWERLGFTRTAQVPHGDTLGFVIVELNGLEVMYQSLASVREDNAASADALFVGGSCLFVEVDDLDGAARAVDGAEVVVPRRTTSYGTLEFGVKDPGGHVIVFAQKV